MRNIFDRSLYFLGSILCLGGIYMFHTYTIHLDEWYPIFGNFVSAYGGLIGLVYHYYITYIKK